MPMSPKPQYKGVKEACDLMFLHNANPHAIIGRVARLCLLYRETMMGAESLTGKYEALRWGSFRHYDQAEQYRLTHGQGSLFEQWLKESFGGELFRDYVMSADGPVTMGHAVKAVNYLFDGLSINEMDTIFTDWLYYAWAYNGYSYNHAGVIGLSHKHIGEIFAHLPGLHYDAVLADPYAGMGDMIYALANHYHIWPHRGEIMLTEIDRGAMELAAIRFLMQGKVVNFNQGSFTYGYMESPKLMEAWKEKADYVASRPPFLHIEPYTQRGDGFDATPQSAWITDVFGKKVAVRTWMACLIAQVNILKHGGYGVIVLASGALGIISQDHTYDRVREWLFEQCDVQYVVELDQMEFQPAYRNGYRAAAVIYQKNPGCQNGVTFINQEGVRRWVNPDDLRPGHNLWPRLYTNDGKY